MLASLPRSRARRAQGAGSPAHSSSVNHRASSSSLVHRLAISTAISTSFDVPPSSTASSSPAPEALSTAPITSALARPTETDVTQDSSNPSALAAEPSSVTPLVLSPTADEAAQTGSTSVSDETASSSESLTTSSTRPNASSRRSSTRHSSSRSTARRTKTTRVSATRTRSATLTSSDVTEQLVASTSNDEVSSSLETESAAPTSGFATESALASATTLDLTSVSASATASAAQLQPSLTATDATTNTADLAAAFSDSALRSTASGIDTSSASLHLITAPPPSSTPTAPTATPLVAPTAWLDPAPLPSPSASIAPAADKSNPVAGIVVALVLAGLLVLSVVFFLGPRTYRALVCRLPQWLTGSQPSSHSNSVHDEGAWVRRTGAGASRSSLEEEIREVRAGSPVGGGTVTPCSSPGRARTAGSRSPGSPGRASTVGSGGSGRRGRLESIREERPVLPALSFQPPSVRSRSLRTERSQESVNGPSHWARDVAAAGQGRAEVPGAVGDSPKSVKSAGSGVSSRTHNSSGTGVSVMSVAALRAAYPYRSAAGATSEHGVIIDMPTSTNSTASSKNTATGSGSRSVTPPSTRASTVPAGGSPESFPETPSPNSRNDSKVDVAAVTKTVTEEASAMPISLSIQSLNPSITTSADLECSTIVTINPAPVRESPALLQSATFDPTSSLISSLPMARAGSSPGMGRSSFGSDDDGRSVYSCHTGLSPQIGVALGSPTPYANFAQFGHSDASLIAGGRPSPASRVVSDASAFSEVLAAPPSPELQPLPQAHVPIMARSVAMQRQREALGETRYLTPETHYGSHFVSMSGSGQGEEYETATEGTHHEGGLAVGNASLRSSGSSWGRKVFGVFRSEEPVTPEIGFGGFADGAY